MKTRTSDKWVNYSYGSIQIKQQVGYCIVGAFLVHGRATNIHELTRLTMTQTWGGGHHLFPYNIFYDWPWGLHPNVIFLGIPKLRIPKFPKLGLSSFWKPPTSCIDLQLRKILKAHIEKFPTICGMPFACI